MFPQISAFFWWFFFLLNLIQFVNGEFKISKKNLLNDLEFSQINPGRVQYIVKPGDFLGLSMLTKTENDELQEICGKTDFKTGRFKVAMGNNAIVGEFPWVVALGDDHIFCTGTIISSRHVITAAHCISEYSDTKLPCKDPKITSDLSRLSISYGGVCVREDGEFCSSGRDMKRAKVRKVLLPTHFNENFCEKGGDIAILELENDLVFDERTKPICLGYFISRFDQTLYDLGFGRDEYNMPVANLRFIGTITVRNNGHVKIGNIVTSPKYFLQDSMKQPGMCHGDSGGPFQINIGYPIRSYLHGIHSFGSGCGKKSDHSSTNVLFYIEWICERTGICRKWNPSKIG